MSHFTIKVAARHISGGVPENPWMCPVALAVQEATGDPSAVVDEDTICVGLEIGWIPNHAVERIRNYDALEGMEPFEFELETGTFEAGLPAHYRQSAEIGETQ